MNTISGAVTSGVAVATAIIGLAIVAVVLSPKSETYKVVDSAGSFFQSLIRQAVSPVSN